MNKKLILLLLCGFMIGSSLQVSAMVVEKEQEKKEYGLVEFKAANPWLFGDAVINIIELNLSNKNIRDMPWIENIPGCDNVQKLNLSDNVIERASGIYAMRDSLTELHLAHNKISKICIGLNIFSKLTQLDLVNNQLTTIKGMFVGLKALQFLYLNLNNIEQIEEGTFPPSIINIFLDNNKIASIAPNAIKDLVHCTRIDLCDNKLTVVDFAKLPNNEKCFINLNGNPIEYFANTSCESKATIWLRDSKLTSQQIAAFKEQNPQKNVDFR